jgi:hypothetical protein
MKKIMIGTLAVAGAALLAATAYAGEGKGRGHGGHWDKMDVNGDGEITADEMNGKSAEFLAAADTDGNGAVSKDEMKAFHEAKRAEHRAKRNPDKNGDGLVDKTEYINAAQERFDKMDKDGNGVLSEDEQHREGRRGHHRRGDKNDG